MMILYSALLSAGLVLSAPWWGFRLLTTNRYREGLRERLGQVPRRLREAVGGRRVVWVHAVSVGEVLAVSRLVEELQEALGAEWLVVVSTTTRTGQALARERFGADPVFYFPLDFRWAVRAYLRALRPALLLLVESELWPRMLYECERSGVAVAVVNARVSDRSFRRAKRVGRLWARLLGRVTLWLAQGKADAARLAALGVQPAALHVTGNLKYDIHAPRESRLPGWIREVAAGRPVIVAGSTTEGPFAEDADEEQIVLAAWWSSVQQGTPSLLVLAPRHPERFGLAESNLTEFAYAKASDWRAAGEESSFAMLPKHEPTQNEYGLTPFQGPNIFVPGHKGRVDVVLLDTIGDLAAVYAIADVAFVGGSLVNRGGHNPLEPAQFGVPVLMGPSFENFREIVAELRAANALCVIEEVEGLETAMLSSLTDRAAARAMGERGRAVFQRQGGATGRTVAALLPLIAASKSAHCTKGEALPDPPASTRQEARV